MGAEKFPVIYIRVSVSRSIQRELISILTDEPNIPFLHSSLSEDAPRLVDIPLNLTGARGKPQVSQGYTKGFDRRFNTWLTPYPPWSPHFHFLFLCPPMFTSRTWLGKLSVVPSGLHVSRQEEVSASTLEESFNGG